MTAVANKFTVELFPTGSAMVVLLIASAVPTDPSVKVEPPHVIEVPSKVAEYAYPSASQPPSGTGEPSATMPTTFVAAAAVEK